MSLKSDTHNFDDIYVQQQVVYERKRSWMIVFEKILLFNFFILQTNPMLIHKFVKGKGKECNVYDILANIFFLA
jgi:hypothetical protein